MVTIPKNELKLAVEQPAHKQQTIATFLKLLSITWDGFGLEFEEELVTKWLDGLVDNEEQAQQRVWELYSAHVAKHAQKLIAPNHRKVTDEDDVTAKVMNSLFMRLADGRMRPPENRKQLWALLTNMTGRKAAEQIRHENAQKRGGGQVRGESIFGSEQDGLGLDQISADKNPSGRKQQNRIENAFSEAVSLINILDSLKDPELQQLVLLRIANHSLEEIAEQMGCSKNTVSRRLQAIQNELRNS